MLTVPVRPCSVGSTTALPRLGPVEADGETAVVAGTGNEGFNDPLNGHPSGSAHATLLKLPAAVAWLGSGEALVADAANDRIRRFNLSGGIRTIAGFDRPDQVLGVPAFPVRARTATLRSGRSSCSGRSSAGRYNLLRFWPLPLGPLHRGKRGTIKIQSSAKANAALTVQFAGHRASTRHLSVRVGYTNAQLPKLRKGSYLLKVDGVMVAKPTGRRCATLVVRVK